MRIVTSKNNDYIKSISYAVLAAGKTSGVWSDETTGNEQELAHQSLGKQAENATH